MFLSYINWGTHVSIEFIAAILPVLSTYPFFCLFFEAFWIAVFSERKITFQALIMQPASSALDSYCCPSNPDPSQNSVNMLKATNTLISEWSIIRQQRSLAADNFSTWGFTSVTVTTCFFFFYSRSIFKKCCMSPCRNTGSRARVLRLKWKCLPVMLVKACIDLASAKAGPRKHVTSPMELMLVQINAAGTTWIRSVGKGCSHSRRGIPVLKGRKEGT